jgi:hypothetical protein
VPGAQATSPAITSTGATARAAYSPPFDLVTGKVYAVVRDRHRSREFIAFLKLLDAPYPAAS